jgi:hypothetical protein
LKLLAIQKPSLDLFPLLFAVLFVVDKEVARIVLVDVIVNEGVALMPL